MSKTAQLFIISAAFLWGLMGLVTRPLTAAGFSLFQIVAARSVIASVGLFTFLLITDREKLKISIKHVPLFVIIGCVLPLNSLNYFNAIEMITLSAAAILLYTAPYMVMAMSALVFKEKITLQKVCALLIAFSGCVMTIGVVDSERLSALGVVSGLAAAFFYALYTILLKVALKNYTPFTVTVYAFGVSGIVLIPICDFGGLIRLAAVGESTALNLLALGFIVTLIPFIFYTKGLEKTEPSRVSIIAFVEPLTASAVGIAMFGEMLTPFKLLGIALIFLSLIILNLKRVEKL